MKKFTTYITELFDKPLKWNEFNTAGKQRKAEFRIGDIGYIITVQPWEDKDGKTLWVEFSIGDKGGVQKSNQSSKFKITGTGNAGQIIATVIDYVKHIMKKEKPTKLAFTASEPSRKKLYKAISLRFKKIGLVKHITQDNNAFILGVK